MLIVYIKPTFCHIVVHQLHYHPFANLINILSLKMEMTKKQKTKTAIIEGKAFSDNLSDRRWAKA